MSLTLSLPEGPVDLNPLHTLPTFKSTRTAPVSKATRNAIRSSKLEAMKETVIELAEEDTWYDEKIGFELFLDIFWARRNVIGEMRSRKSYYNTLKWQAAATLPLFPPLGMLLILFNTCFGLHAKGTRAAFIASCVFAVLFIANATLTSDPTTLASLK